MKRNNHSQARIINRSFRYLFFLMLVCTAVLHPAHAVLAGGSSSSSSDDGPSTCEGGIVELTLFYQGSDGVNIDVYRKSNRTEQVAAFANVMSRSTLVVDARNVFNGKLRGNTYIVIDGNDPVKIHTSCSQDIVGVAFDKLTVLSHTDKQQAFELTICDLPGNWALGGNIVGELCHSLGTINEEDLVLVTHGTEKAVLTTDGNLGIGLPAPTEKLQVAGAIAPAQDKTFDLGTSNLRWNNIYAGQLNLGGFTSGSVIFTGNAGSLVENNSHLFWDDTNKRLGIGTNSPDEDLEVSGTIKTDNFTLTNGADNDLVLTAKNNVGEAAWKAIPPDEDWRGGGSGIVTLGTSSDKVGIGITNPGAKLDVAGNIHTNATVAASAFASNSPFIMEAPAGTERARIDDNTGHFGIGTDQPGERLDVDGKVKIRDIPQDNSLPNLLVEDNGVIHYRQASSLDDGDWSKGTDAGTGYGTLSPYNNTDLVGIGTSFPDAKLHVKFGSVLFTHTQNVSAGTPVSGGGTRLMWIPGKAAFRAGTVSDDEWNDGNIGNYSFAVGRNTKASDQASIAIGEDVSASSDNTIAIGSNASAEDDFAIAIGNYATATMENGIAIGHDVAASGVWAAALGNLTSATAEGSMVWGKGDYSTTTPLENDSANSLMIGFNSDIPTVFVGASGGVGTTGRVGIGTQKPQSKLSVNGMITAKAVKVTADGWGDFVLAPDYPLATLEEVDQFIKQNQHLPGIPSEKEVLREGIDLGAMDALLIQKIEELTLYTIALKAENDTMKEDIRALKHLLNKPQGK